MAPPASTVPPKWTAMLFHPGLSCPTGEPPPGIVQMPTTSSLLACNLGAGAEKIRDIDRAMLVFSACWRRCIPGQERGPPPSHPLTGLLTCDGS